MPFSLNKVMIIGNVGKAPELRYTANGVGVASFPVATSRRWNSPDGEVHEETEWFSVVSWRQQAEFVNQYLQKGSRVFVEGRLQTRSWEGQDGLRHYRTEVIANSIILLDRRQRAPEPPEEAEPAEAAEAAETDLDEIPF